MAIQVCFCKAAGENLKELLPEIFLSYQKRIFLIDLLIILQLSVNDFQVGANRKNNNITRNSSRSNILILLTLLSAVTKLAVLLRILPLTKVQLRNFPLLHFTKWLCLVLGQLAMPLRRVKKLIICKCQCFYLFDIQQWSVLS